MSNPQENDSSDIVVSSEALPPTAPKPIEAPAPDLEKVSPEPTVEHAELAALPTKESASDKLARARVEADRAKAARIRRQREAQESQRLRYEREQLAQQALFERQQREAAERKAEMVDALRDPDPNRRSEAMYALGISPREIAEQAVAESTPEGQARILRSQLEAERKERLEYQRQQEQRAAAARQQQAESDFLKQAQDTETYPTLARLAKSRPQALIREANDIAETAAQRNYGRYPSFEQILSYLEHEYSKALHDDRPARNEGPPQRTEKIPAKESQPAASVRTIPARASERAQIPKSLGQMNREEQIAYFAAQLRDSSRG